jgi:hypothetical protein
MQLTVQLPPIQLLTTLGQRVLDHRHVHRVEDDDRVGSMRRVLAASIQWPVQPAARSLGKTSLV